MKLIIANFTILPAGFRAGTDYWYDSQTSTDPNSTQSEGGPAFPSGTSPSQLPTIHEAELAQGASGVVYWEKEIDFITAVARRSMGGNVVVRGDDLRANRRLAAQIEQAVGFCVRQEPHKRQAGPWALPHYQQLKRDPRRHRGTPFMRRRAERHGKSHEVLHT